MIKSAFFDEAEGGWWNFREIDFTKNVEEKLKEGNKKKTAQNFRYNHNYVLKHHFSFSFFISVCCVVFLKNNIVFSPPNIQKEFDCGIIISCENLREKKILISCLFTFIAATLYVINGIMCVVHALIQLLKDFT